MASKLINEPIWVKVGKEMNNFFFLLLDYMFLDC